MRISDWSSDVCSSDLLIKCDTPAAIRRAKPTGISSLAGQRNRPPELEEYSWVSHESMNIGQDSHMISTQAGSRKNRTPKISILICERREHRWQSKDRTCGV